jgi:3-hexulose-6-phosphate synthase
VKIQLALDRFSIEDAIKIASQASQYVDWIEVGTSLIKEFGVQSILSIRKAFPDKVIVADIKTFDNAEYEMNLCFDAGADVATVLGAASAVTIDKCVRSAIEKEKQIMIDLASVAPEKWVSMPVGDHIVWCLHVSKDEQEALHVRQEGEHAALQQVPVRPTIAIAGGITKESVPLLSPLMPDIAIVGSYITKARDPHEASRKVREAANQLEMAQR